MTAIYSQTLHKCMHYFPLVHKSAKWCFITRDRTIFLTCKTCRCLTAKMTSERCYTKFGHAHESGSPCTTSEWFDPALDRLQVTGHVHALTRALAHTFKTWYRPFGSHFSFKTHGAQVSRGLLVLSLSLVHSVSFYLGQGDVWLPP